VLSANIEIKIQTHQNDESERDRQLGMMLRGISNLIKPSYHHRMCSKTREVPFLGPRMGPWSQLAFKLPDIQIAFATHFVVFDVRSHKMGP